MSTDLRSLVAAMPKVELHRHLEGSMRASTIAELGRTYHLPLPTYDAGEIDSLLRLTEPVPNLEAFLQPFIHVMKYCFVNRGVIARITYEAIEDAALDNIRHLELRFSVECMGIYHELSMAEVMDGIVEGMNLATGRFPIKVGLILSVNRAPVHPVPQEVADLAVTYADQGVVGFDLSGLEEGWPASVFSSELETIRAAGLGITVHAGEDSGPESIRDAIESGASRIGHGVRIVQDPEVIKLALDRGICLEVCPTSNVLTRAVESLESHPIRKLYEMGLCVTVNTDDPTVCGVSLTDECVLLVERFGFTLDDIGRLMENARQAAF